MGTIQPLVMRLRTHVCVCARVCARICVSVCVCVCVCVCKLLQKLHLPASFLFRLAKEVVPAALSAWYKLHPALLLGVFYQLLKET